MAALTLLVACGGGQQARLSGEGQGGAAADEPHAASVARDVLAVGGSAADAAVATALALSVTYPVAASLGGGGACVVFDGPTGTVEALEFLPRTPRSGGPVAVPGMVRGLAALHARYGRLAWNDIVRPAEGLARAGHPLSRAMARNIAALSGAISESESLARWLDRNGDGLVGEGDGLVQIEISSTLSLLRTRGAGDLYSGLLGRQFVDASRRMGGEVTMQDLREYIPVWSTTEHARTGELTIHTMPLPITGGTIAGQAWLMLANEDRYRGTSTRERPHLIAEVLQRAYSLGQEGRREPMSTFRAHALMRSYDADQHAPRRNEATSTGGELPVMAGGDGATAFVVGDDDGSAVACNLALGSPFGIGAWDPVTGIVPAATSKIPATRAHTGPMLVVRSPDDLVVFAGAASGGAAAPAALVQVTTATISDNIPLTGALALPRLLHLGVPDRVILEPTLPATAVGSLAQRGHEVFRAEPIGFVNGLYCESGLGRGKAGCSYGADPRGSGLNLSQ